MVKEGSEREERKEGGIVRRGKEGKANWNRLPTIFGLKVALLRAKECIVRRFSKHEAFLQQHGKIITLVDSANLTWTYMVFNVTAMSLMQIDLIYVTFIIVIFDFFAYRIA